MTIDPEIEKQRRLALRAGARHDEFEDVQLPELPYVPGMIGPGECRYLYWLASATWTGAGDIVELGSWLGRSAQHLAAGMRDSGKTGTLWCFDRFEFERREHRKNDAHRELLKKLKRGADLRPTFRANVAPIHPVFAVKTKIEKMRWHGAPVEILFLDAPKQPDVLLHVFQQFAPALTPGVSFVSSQDFGYPLAWCQALFFSRLSDCLELVHTVGWTAGFRVVKPLPSKDELAKILAVEDWSIEQATTAFDAILAKIEDEHFRERLRPAICFYLYRNGQKDLACRRMKELVITPYTRDRWQEWVHGGHWDQWSGLFEAIGLQPPPRRVEAEAKRAAKQAKKKEEKKRKKGLRGLLARVAKRGKKALRAVKPSRTR